MNVYQTLLDELESKVSENIKRENGDYEKDGLIYCGKCNTPKQARIEAFGKTYMPFCLCECAQKKEADREQAEKEKERNRMLEYRRSIAFSDSRLLSYRFENSDHADEHGEKVCQNYTEHFKEFRQVGRGLILYGNVGTGKTFLAACIANALIDAGYRCKVTSFSRIVNELQESFDNRQEVLDSLNDFDLIVFDDFAAERNTEYMKEQVFSIIDNRLRSQLPMIITTNLTAEDLKKPNDLEHQRIYSRLYEMCVPVEVIGEDRRKAKLREGFKDVSGLLGL